MGYPFRGLVLGLVTDICEQPSCCFGECGLDLLSALQTLRQPRFKRLKEPVDFFLFLHEDSIRRLPASGFLRSLVAKFRVSTCKIVAAPIAVMGLHGVRLALLAVPPKRCPRAESLLPRAKLAFDDPHPSALPFGLGRQEHRSVPLRQGSRDRAEVLPVFRVLLKNNLLLRRAPHLALRFHLLSPHDPRRLFLRKETHRPLRDTKSQQGSMVYSLRCRGLEPLRSASRRLGYTIEFLLGLHDQGSTSPFRGRRLPWDPSHTLLAPLLRAGGFIFVAVFCRQTAG